MNPTDHLLTHNNQSSNCHAIDVKLFFIEITEYYDSFTKNVVELINNMEVYSPEQISDECSRLSEKRNKLTDMDQQMFNIIDLAGNELAQRPMVDEYKIAFAKANMACNDLYQKLLLLKTMILQGPQ